MNQPSIVIAGYFHKPKRNWIATEHKMFRISKSVPFYNNSISTIQAFVKVVFFFFGVLNAESFGLQTFYSGYRSLIKFRENVCN